MCLYCGHEKKWHTTITRNSIPTPWCMACAKDVKVVDGFDDEWDVAECMYIPVYSGA